MKIIDLLVEYDRSSNSNKRSCKLPILHYTKSKTVKFLGLDLIEHYIYSKYWHSVHTKEEMKDKYFYCLICEEPEYFEELFSLVLQNRINAFNPIMYLMKIYKWLIHFWHKYYFWINDLPCCSICYRRYLNKLSITELREWKYHYFDMGRTPEPDEPDLWRH